MSRLSDDLSRSALAGASTGGRTFTALATLALTARPDATERPDAVLAAPWARGVLGFLALAELVADKLPAAPSRLEAPGLPGRLVAGAACGAIIARREAGPHTPGWTGDPTAARTTDPTELPEDATDTRNRTLACALAGLAAAAVTSWTGVRWRSRAASVFGRDWVGAGLEDVVTIGLAAGAARGR